MGRGVQKTRVFSELFAPVCSILTLQFTRFPCKLSLTNVKWLTTLTKHLLRFHRGSYGQGKKSRNTNRTFIRVLQIVLKHFLLNRDGLWVIIKLSPYQIFDYCFSREMRARYFHTMAVSLCKSSIPFTTKSVN